MSSKSSGSVKAEPTSYVPFGLALPPHNIEAEQALLGALLVNNEAAERIGDLLKPDHFYDPLHGQIYEVAMRLIAGGKLANPITLRPIFEEFDQITEGLTVPFYIGRLIVGAPPWTLARDYAREIVDLAVRRQLMSFAEHMYTAARDANPQASTQDLVAAAEQELFQLGERGREGAEVGLDQAVVKALDAANEAYQRGGTLVGLPTGYTDIDERLAGLQKSDLIVLAGRPSMGKTALATNIAYNVAREAQHVHFFSQEMSAVQLATRLLAERSGLSTTHLRWGKFEADDWPNIATAGRHLSELPVTIDETGGISLPQLSSRARRLKRKAGTALIIIDYLQLMAGGRRENRTQDITELTCGLKALAKELDVPIILLSQLSRQVEGRADKRPQLSDLRESGSIEQDADVVLFVYRDDYYLERSKPDEGDIEKMCDWQAKMANASGKAEVIIAKHRQGPTGIINLTFDAKLTRFSSAAEVRHA